MLEAGRRHRYFPQSYFPFTSPLDITDLQDRMYLKHESFALCSQHAHLPIPYEINYGDIKQEHIHVMDQDRSMSPMRSPGAEITSPTGERIHTTLSHTPEGRETSRRPMFDMGIYERPNMLSLQGVEPGTIGMRNFLELPVADGLVTHGREEHGGKDSDIGSDVRASGIDLDKTPAFEAFKVLAHEEGSAKIGKHAPMQDRVEIVKGGPKAWRRIGVRGITMRSITERLEQVGTLRNKIVDKGWRYTILEEIGADALGKQLFGEFLYPPGKIGAGSLSSSHGEGDLKVQIEALVKVLTTPGAWLDFSLPAERLLFSQNIYTREVKGEDVQGIKAEEKRRWGLIQLLLALELVIRLDAALRKGVASHSKDLPISSEEIHHFNKLRNLKVDWDLLVSRRWLDLCYAKRMPKEIHGQEEEQGVTRPQEQHSASIFGRMKHSLSFDKGREDPDNTDWDVAILPRQSKVMGEGLLRFGADIGWPQQSLDAIRESFIKKLRDSSKEEKEEMLARGVETLDHPHVPQHAMDKSTVELRPATEKTLGGPLSHAWLGGLVLPGYITCDLLMCTLLENDPGALGKLGIISHPRSGFVLDGRSYWSKTCIIAGVLACMEDGKERMGWVGLPEGVGPVNEELESFGDGWRVINAEPPPNLREGDRIYDGEALSKESSPLGEGHGKVTSREFSMLTDHILDDLGPKCEVRNVELMLNKKGGNETNGAEYNASVGFQVVEGGQRIGEGDMKQMRLPLKYGVHFIGAHPCRPPHGHIGVQSPAPEGKGANEILGRPTTAESGATLSTTATEGTPSHSSHHPKHKHAEHLPAHPLHKSYKYIVKSIAEIIELGENDWLPFPMDKEAGSVWIVDARGSWEREVLLRAWCAKVGRHAIVSRVGKGCLGCAVREARGLEVGVIIRIG